MDADGSIYIDNTTGLFILSITQKNKFLLDPLVSLYGGKIIISSTKDSFQYIIYRRKEIVNLIDSYFSKYPLKSSKAEKIHLIKDFFKLEIHPKALDFNIISSNNKKAED